jgi:CHAD domain-containing protein
MAFQLKIDEPLSKGVRRIVKDQIDKVIDELTGLSDQGPEEVVHEARKRFKRVRAVLRLARPGLELKLYARENTRFRDAGRPLSEVRDAEALAVAFDALIERTGDSGHVEAVSSIRSALAERKREVSRRVLDEENALEAATAAVLEARRGVKRWQIAGEDQDIIESGVGRIYRKGRRASREASCNPTDEHLHEWRKRVKDLWYVLDILGPLRPEFFQDREAEAHRLADALGDDHDLAVLRRIIADPDSGVGNGVQIEAILPLIDLRRAELQADAFSLGKSVFTQKPKAYVASLGG